MPGVRRHQEVGLSVRPKSSSLAGRYGTSRSSKSSSGVPTSRRLMPSSQVSAIGFAPTRFASPPPDPLPTLGCLMSSPATMRNRERQGSSPSELSSAASSSSWVGRIHAASQKGDRFMFLTWWGEQTGGDAETRARGGAELAAPRHPAGPAHRWGALHTRGREASPMGDRVSGARAAQERSHKHLSRFFPHAFTSLPHMTNQADFVTA
jgi:hypothetical protein